VFLVLGLLNVAIGTAAANPVVLAPSPPDDPAALGVLTPARAQILPGHEARLRVREEHLSITFGDEVHRPEEYATQPPMVLVTASYSIENPTDADIRAVFGYPILRDIHKYAYVLSRDTGARLDGERVDGYGVDAEEICSLLCRSLRRSIEEAIDADPELRALVDSVPAPSAHTWPGAARALATHLGRRRGWTEEEALWLVAYSSLGLEALDVPLPDERVSGPVSMTYPELLHRRFVRLGALARLDERVACQFLERVAALLDAGATTGYADVVRAWGGTDKELAVDLATGALRPRVAPVRPASDSGPEAPHWLEPVILAKPGSVFEALPEPPPPMVLVLYEVEFPARNTREFRVTDKQFAFMDGAGTGSNQTAFVIHTAARWDDFGPISVEVLAPEGCSFRASFPCEATGAREVAASDGVRFPATVYEGNVQEKNGQILVAVGEPSWRGFAQRIGEQLLAEQAEAKRKWAADHAGPPPAVRDGGGRTVWFTFGFGGHPWPPPGQGDHGDE
jgi:hypothetical protein